MLTLMLPYLKFYHASFCFIGFLFAFKGFWQLCSDGDDRGWTLHTWPIWYSRWISALLVWCETIQAPGSFCFVCCFQDRKIMTVCVHSVIHKQTCSSCVSPSFHPRHLKTSKKRSVFNSSSVWGTATVPFETCLCGHVEGWNDSARDQFLLIKDRLFAGGIVLPSRDAISVHRRWTRVVPIENMSNPFSIAACYGGWEAIVMWPLTMQKTKWVVCLDDYHVAVCQSGCSKELKSARRLTAGKPGFFFT